MKVLEEMMRLVCVVGEEKVCILAYNNHIVGVVTGYGGR